MTTTTTTHPEVGDISTPALTDRESAKLLDCINSLRTGERVYLARVVYNKQTKAKPRIAGEDYVSDPALAINAHEGLLYAAPSNKKGEVYLRMADGARRPGEDAEHGYTCMKLAGVRSFKVLAEFPGHVAQEREAQAETAREEREAQAETAREEREAKAETALAKANDARALMAQAMVAQAQATVLMGQSLLTQTESRS